MSKNQEKKKLIDRYADAFKQAKPLFGQLVTPDLQKRLESSLKVIRMIKRHTKVTEDSKQDFKLSPVDQEKIYSSCFDKFSDLLSEIDAILKEDRTDWQAVLFKKKNNSQPIIKEIVLLDFVDSPPLNYDNVLNNINYPLQYQTVKEVANIAAQGLQRLPFSKTLDIDKGKFSQLMAELSQEYRVLPYHNFTHAVNVFIMFRNCYAFQELTKYFDDFELFFSGLACLGHDIGHQGVNNLYHTKLKSELAVENSYTSTLEKMHVYKMIQFLETKAPFIMGKLTGEQKTRAKRIIGQAILSTDMALHYGYIDRLKEYDPKISTKKLSSDRAAHRQFLIEVFVHACDIGNPCLDFSNYIHWAHLICVEFDDQTIKEEASGAVITQYLKFTNINDFYKTQQSFNNSVVLPLWIEITNIFPSFQKYLVNISTNIKQIEEQIKIGQQVKKEPISKGKKSPMRN